MGSPSFQWVLGLALTSLVAAVVLFFLDLTLYSSLAALLSIFLFYKNGFDSFTTRNSVSYSHKSITISLLGRKTFGFLFNELKQLDLSEKGLYLKVKGQEEVKLSRKRYADQSLEKLYKILKEKKASYERR